MRLIPKSWCSHMQVSSEVLAPRLVSSTQYMCVTRVTVNMPKLKESSTHLHNLFVRSFIRLGAIIDWGSCMQVCMVGGVV